MALTEGGKFVMLFLSEEVKVVVLFLSEEVKFVVVELLKQAHTVQLAQQAGAADIRYLTVDAGRANNRFHLLNTNETEMMRLKRIAHLIV